MKNLFRRKLLTGIGMASFALLVTAASSHAAIDPRFLVYDSIGGIENGVNGAFVATGGTPRNFIGDAVNFYYPPAGPITITGIDLGFAYRGSASTTLSALNVNLRFYETTSNTGDVFSTPVTSVLSFDARQPIVTAYNAANNTNFTVDNFVFTPGANYFYQLELPTTFNFADRNLNGIAVNYAANTGAGLFTNDTLTSVLRIGPPVLVGSSGFGTARGGFFRNASGRTDYNFNQNDSRTLTAGGFTDNAGLAMRFYTNQVIVPETNTLVLWGAAAVVPMVGMVRRRRKK